MRLIPDGAHFLKSTDSSVQNHRIRLQGQFVGNFQIWSRYHDADRGRRDAVRGQLSANALRAKNRFSVEQMVERRERSLQAKLLSPEEWEAKEALIISTLGPARDKQWKENTPSMYDQPMGGVHDPASNLYFYVDMGRKELRVLKVSHSPADNEAVITSKLRRPIDVALIGSNLYITDSDYDQPCIWVVSVAAVQKKFSAAAEAAAGGETIQKLSLDMRGDALKEPYGIVADPSGDAIYISDRAGKQLVCIVLATPTQGRSQQICPFEQPPAGVDLIGNETIVVAAGDRIYKVVYDRNNSGPVMPDPILHMEGAEFCGVNVAPAAHGGDLFAINRKGNSLLRLKRSGSDRHGFASSATLLAGGNTDFPQGVWHEGTSHKVKLWGPTFGTFAHNSFIFSNAGRGGRFGKVLLLSDLYPMAGLLMPALCTIADAFSLSDQGADHAFNWTHASVKLADVRDLFDSIEDDNHNLNKATRGAEGPAGNFSNVCRRSARQLAQLLQDEVVELVELGVPPRIIDALSPRSLLTLGVENFFITMRAHWPNPYSLQYQSNHATSVLLQAFRTRGSCGFAWFTGPQSRRRHYTDAQSSHVTVRYCLRKPKPLDVADRPQTLSTLHEFARLFQQARQQRVTDKGKERVGTRPSITYAPAAISVLEVPTLQSLDDQNSTAQGASGGSEVQIDVLYRAGDIVGVSGGRSGLWFAQLEENLVRVTTPASGRRREVVKYNNDRPKVRYFVRTCELATWPIAAAYWGEIEVRGAEEVSQLSGGVHFSFEKQDSVSCEAIYSAISSFEHQRNAEGKLDRFAISPSDYQQLRAMVCDLGDSPVNECGDNTSIKWQRDGHPFVHQHVAVKHGRKVSLGLITKWVPESEEGDPALWHMVHDDGDEEDLEEGEVRDAMALHLEESGRVQKEQQVSRSGRKRTGLDVAKLLSKRPRK